MGGDQRKGRRQHKSTETGEAGTRGVAGGLFSVRPCACLCVCAVGCDACGARPQLSGRKEGSRTIEAVPLVSLMYQASMIDERCTHIARVHSSHYLSAWLVVRVFVFACASECYVDGGGFNSQTDTPLQHAYTDGLFVCVCDCGFMVFYHRTRLQGGRQNNRYWQGVRACAYSERRKSRVVGEYITLRCRKYVHRSRS